MVGPEKERADALVGEPDIVPADAAERTPRKHREDFLSELVLPEACPLRLGGGNPRRRGADRIREDIRRQRHEEPAAAPLKLVEVLVRDKVRKLSYRAGLVLGECLD